MGDKYGYIAQLYELDYIRVDSDDLINFYKHDDKLLRVVQLSKKGTLLRMIDIPIKDIKMILEVE